MDTTTATFFSALALSSPLWLAVIAGKLIEHQARKNHPTNNNRRNK
jgi:hypothetical protein